MPAPTDLQRLDTILIPRAKIEKTRPGRPQEPLVAITAIEIAGHVRQLDRYHPRDVGSVNNRQNPTAAGLGTEFASGEHQAGRRKYMAKEKEPSVFRKGGTRSLDDFRGAFRHGRQLERAEAEPLSLG